MIHATVVKINVTFAGGNRNRAAQFKTIDSIDDHIQAPKTRNDSKSLRVAPIEINFRMHAD